MSGVLLIGCEPYIVRVRIEESCGKEADGADGPCTRTPDVARNDGISWGRPRGARGNNSWNLDAPGARLVVVGGEIREGIAGPGSPSCCSSLPSPINTFSRELRCRPMRSWMS